jgi:3-deoxy-D-manno-octulosonic-acid transferase
MRRVSAETLGPALVEILNDLESAAAMGERGRRVFVEQAGATARSVAAIERILAEKGAA